MRSKLLPLLLELPLGHPAWAATPLPRGARAAAARRAAASVVLLR
jgi:hypothetical protein